jgi:hypothetical protein
MKLPLDNINENAVSNLDFFLYFLLNNLLKLNEDIQSHFCVWSEFLIAYWIWYKLESKTIVKWIFLRIIVIQLSKGTFSQKCVRNFLFKWYSRFGPNNKVRQKCLNLRYAREYNLARFFKSWISMANTTTWRPAAKQICGRITRKSS